MCLVTAVVQLLGLMPSRQLHLPVLLKAATAGTHSAAILSLLECDTRQVILPTYYIKKNQRRDSTEKCSQYFCLYSTRTNKPFNNYNV